MSFSAFYTGLSGLKAHAVGLNVIGNNLANVNTIGYKSSRVAFSDLFSASGGFGVNGAGVPHQVGSGVQLASVQQMFHQGSMQPSEIATDLAIQGNGFFTLKSDDALPVYTRAGNFSFDANGFLVAPNGFRVQGWTSQGGVLDPTGAVNDIQIPTGLTAAPEQTSFFRLAMNLSADAQPVGANALLDPADTFSSAVTVFDSKGMEHNVTLVFTATGSGTWDWEARIDKTDLAAPAAGATPYQVLNSGTMTFGSDGQLSTMTGTAGNVTLAAGLAITVPAFSNGAATQDVTWALQDAAGAGVVTGYGGSSAVNNLELDGYGMGRLQALAVNDDGQISGVFTNGQTLGLAQLALCAFNAPEGLLRRGENMYMASIGSGPAVLGTAGSGGRGAIASRALELSNVDITDQFTELIITERGYQANSRIITTTDNVMQEALQLKR